jgi:hypothetical protein
MLLWIRVLEVTHSCVLGSSSHMLVSLLVLGAVLVQQYVELRRGDAEQAREGRTILTPRQLLSILRMAQVRACVDGLCCVMSTPEV